MWGFAVLPREFAHPSPTPQNLRRRRKRRSWGKGGRPKCPVLVQVGPDLWGQGQARESEHLVQVKLSISASFLSAGPKKK